MANYLKKILNNCDEVSMHSVKGAADKVSILKRLEFFIHLVFCKCCKNFEVQNKKIDKSLNALVQKIEKNPPFVLSEDFKKKLQEKLK